MRVALDTNRYVDLCKGLAGTVALLEEAEAILLPFVVLGELRAGFAHAALLRTSGSSGIFSRRLSSLAGLVGSLTVNMIGCQPKSGNNFVNFTIL